VVEVHEPRDEPPERGLRGGPDPSEDAAEVFGQLARAERQSRHDSKRPAPAALERPEQIGVRAAIRDPHRAVCRYHFGLEQSGGGETVIPREAPESAALHQPGDPDRRAPPALRVSTGAGRHRVVDLRPDRAGPHGHGRRRRNRTRAALGDEGIVERDALHLPRPDQQRIRRARRALVAVPTALHDESQAVVAREIDGRDDVSGLRSPDRIGAGSGHPGIQVAGRLGQRRLVADVEGVSRRRRRHGELDQATADVPSQPLPGRLGGPGRISWPDTTERRSGLHGPGTAGRHDRQRGGALEELASVHGGGDRSQYRWQATRRRGAISLSVGSSSEQRGIANGQRG
jgi:hypothetical protein